MRYSLITEENSDITILRCPNKLCKHVWKYKGKSKFYASCTYCRTNVHVVRDRVDVEECKNISNLAPNSPAKDQIASSAVLVEGGP